MTDYPKLRIPLLCFLVAALAVALVLRVQLPDWLRFWLVAVAVILGLVGIATLIDWMTYTAAARLRDIGNARTYPMRQLASAIRDLTSNQADAILALDQTYIELIANEAGPVFLVRTLSGPVPFDFVQDFLERSKETDPYLWPVRECSNKDWGAWVTNLIIAKGWAEHGTGPMPAKMIRPVKYIGERFGMEL